MPGRPLAGSGSMIPRPLAAVQQTSIQPSQVLRGDLMGLARHGSGALASGAGSAAGSGTTWRAAVCPGRTSRRPSGLPCSSASPSSKWPLIRYCMAARRWSSNASAAVDPGGRREIALAPPRGRARRSPGHPQGPIRSRWASASSHAPSSEGEPVQLGGAVEGQGLRRLLGRLRVIRPRAQRLARRLEVDGQDLGIGPARSFQHRRQPPVVARPVRPAGRGRPRPRGRGRGRPRSGRLPAGRCRGSAGPPAECSRPCARSRPAPAARDASEWPSGRPETATTSSRRRASSGSRPMRHQSTSSRATSFAPAHAVQQAGLGLDVSHQLGDEERVAPRLAGDRRGVARAASSSRPRSSRARASASAGPSVPRASSRRSKPGAAPSRRASRARSSGLVAASSLR